MNLPKAAVLMKTPAVGAQLWHKKKNGTGIGPEAGEPGNRAGGYCGTAGHHCPNGEVGRGPGSPAVRRWPGGRATKPAARRKKPAEQEKKRRKERPHGFARTRMEPTRRAVHAPESCRECHTTLTGGWVRANAF